MMRALRNYLALLLFLAAIPFMVVAGALIWLIDKIDGDD
jgi:hypothetical protein